jgi:hypothetical protein
MTAWLALHFFNPAFVAGGAMLLASPIIIHLINRMRFRRVRFAAMEFLLASQQRNRQRLLLEQLILLLLRLLIVAAIVLLISRLILDPSQMSIFRGARAHHVVLLDDSLSMRDRWGGTSCFAEAIKIVSRLVAGGAEQPNTQKLTLLRLSKPDQPVLSERDVNDDFVTELSAKFDPQAFFCTHRALDLVEGLRSIRKLLSEEKGAVQHLHVLSDFREGNWQDQKAISAAVDDLTNAGVTVNLVRTVPEAHANLAVTELTGDVQVAAADVPLRLKVGVKNFGLQVATDVRLALFDNGEKIPTSVLFEKIDPQAEVTHDMDVRLTTSGKHRLRVSLDADSLVEDNARSLAVDVPKAVPVLIVDGHPSGDDGSYIADALAADPKSTGFAPVIEQIEYLRRRPLGGFVAIYLINVAEIPADALDSLEKYVSAGGGLVWFVGQALRVAHYNDALYRHGEGLFPVPLDLSPRELAADSTNPGADLRTVKHPLFRIFEAEGDSAIGRVRIDRYFPVVKDWIKDDQLRQDAVRTLGTLRNGDPLLLEHPFGKGRVFTCLTTVSPDWNNWATDYSFVVVQLELIKHIASSDRSPETRQVGEPIQLQINPADYTDSVEVVSPAPDGERTTRLQASPEQTTAKSVTGSTDPATPGPLRLTATYRDTDEPGIYTVRLMTHDQVGEDRLLAYNVSPREGDLQLVTTFDLRKRLSGNSRITIQEFGQMEWVQGKEAGSEIRQWLLWSLLACLIAEQTLAYKLSYHPSAPSERLQSSARKGDATRRIVITE